MKLRAPLSPCLVKYVTNPLASGFGGDTSSGTVLVDGVSKGCARGVGFRHNAGLLSLMDQWLMDLCPLHWNETNGGPSEMAALFMGINMSDIATRVKKIVIEHLGVEADKVIDTANFIDDLGADSLDTVELVMAFEEEFSVEIPDDAAETIRTVGDAVSFLEKKAG